MIDLPGFKVTERLYESSQTVIYRGIRASDNLRVVLKSMNMQYPSAEDIAKFKREYEITQRLTIEGVIEAYSLEAFKNHHVMVMEDFNGKSLNFHLSERRLTLEEFLSVAIQTSDILGRIHQHHIMHKDVNPSNIIWNSDDNVVKIIDFGISATLPKEQLRVRPPGVLEGTLSYISPEQTGRMNRALDYRTDLYSLGATLYELATGQPPFLCSDLMELIHFHMARRPVPPDQRNPDVPGIISDIILKLLSKAVEDRYQGAFGLNADLKRCKAQLEAHGTIEPFEICQQDFSGLFHIPQKLYGRDEETHILLNTFHRVCQGGPELLLVDGHTGIGKTFLVHEIYKPVVAAGAYFISGKFSQLNRNTPYSSIIDATRDMIRQFLTEGEKRIAEWRTLLLDALGPNGKLMIDVIPELEYIIGDQKDVPDLSPNESLNRFNRVFYQFIRAIAKRNHPLVIFLDDLQWIDQSSLQLITQFMTYPDPQALLIIGAYRNNEVNATHPLMLVIDDIKKTDTRVTSIHLEPLQPAHVNQLVAETLNADSEATRPLSQLCFDKTQGNPFFLNQFFTSLYEHGDLFFNADQGIWEWDISAIQQKEITSNVIEFMVDRIKKLPPAATEVIKLAACIGNRFDLKVLSMVCDISEREAADTLWPCLEVGFILPLDETYRYAGETGGEKIGYRFLHDRVYQSAYTMLDPSEKELLHIKIGRLLLDHNKNKGTVKAAIFDIVNHMNSGKKYLKSREERLELADLNTLAGKKAKSSAAFEAAFNYFNTALELTASRSWDTAYGQNLESHLAAAETAYLSGEHERMDEICQAALDNATSVVDRAKIYEIQIMGDISRKRLKEAIDLALNTLRLLGVSLPRNAGKPRVMFGLLKTKIALSGKQMDDLLALPKMTDPGMLIATRIMYRIVPTVYSVSPMLNLIIVFKYLELSLKFGNAAYTIFAYDNFGAILCGVLGDIDNGYRFGELMPKLADRFNAKDQECRILFFTHAFIRHWKNPLDTTLRPILNAYKIGLETGDLEFAAISAHNYCLNKFLTGGDMVELEKEMAQYSRMMKQTKQEMPLCWNQIWHQAVLNLIGRSQFTCRLIGGEYNEESQMADHLRTKDRTATFIVYLAKLMLCYIFGEYETAMENAEKAKKEIESVFSMPCFSLFFFYEALTCLALYPVAPRRKKSKLLKKAKAAQKRLAKWEHFSPENYTHKYSLVTAEISRISGDDANTRFYYTRAIEKAHDNRYTQEEAMACERYALYWKELNEADTAAFYFSRARYGYQIWGADAKVSSIESEFSDMIRQSIKTDVNGDLASTTATTSILSTQRLTEVLDLESIIKAHQAISSTIMLHDLLDTLMNVLIENAGAEKCVFLMQKERDWFIEAVKTTHETKLEVLMSIPVNGSDERAQTILPLSIIEYVSRTLENVFLSDALQDEKFSKDPYIARYRPKSVLCAPIRRHKTISGMIYLENTLLTDAFTQDRINLLRLFSAQISISLENAKLYEELEQRVAQRTRELEESLELLKNTQEHLVQSEKMAALGGLVAGVAHEINTPLGVSITAVSYLDEKNMDFLEKYGTDAVPPAEMTKYVREVTDATKMIYKNLMRAADLIQGFKKVAVDQSTESLRKFNIKEYIGEILLSLKPKFKNQQHAISADCPDDLEVHSFPGAYSQIITNLVMNTLEHGFKGVDSGKIKIEATASDKWVSLRYSDDGTGMDKTILDKIYDPFFTTARARGGTGLGMHIVYNLVTQKLKGQIKCTSSPGKGTTYEIKTPIDVSH